jgi:hypothetical protein
MSSTRDSFAGERSGLAPASVPTSVKRELGADGDGDGDGDRDARGKAVSVAEGNLQPRKTALAELPTLLANRRRLDRLLHELVRSHRWGDAAGVISALVSGTRHPESFDEMRSVFAVSIGGVPDENLMWLQFWFWSILCSLMRAKCSMKGRDGDP